MSEWDVVGVGTAPTAGAEVMPPAMADEQRRRDDGQARATVREAPLMGGPGGKPAAVGGSVRIQQLPGEADLLFDRVTTVEGTRGNPWQIYGGDTFKPGKDHPGEAAKRSSPNGTTHAAGPGQWQETTWNGRKSAFRERFGRDPDFSNLDDQKAMTWLEGAAHYPGGEAGLLKDLREKKLDESKLAGVWEGFKKGGGGEWSVTSSGQWRVKPDAIAHEQGRSNTRVVWMSPDEYLGMLPEGAGTSSEKRKSLMRSLGMGEEIEAIPSLDVRQAGARAKVIDQDGANRARIAKQSGVEAIPVAVHGIAGDTAWLEDMNGTARRFNFDAVAPVKAQPQPRAFLDAPGTGRGAGPLSAERVLPAIGRGIVSALDRIGGAEVEGARQGFGEAPLGQGTEIGRGLSSVGTPGELDAGLPARAAGSAFDAVARGAQGVAQGALQGGGQLAREVGLPEAVAGGIEHFPELAAGLVGVGGAPPVVPGGFKAVPRAMPQPQIGSPVNTMLRTIQQSTKQLNDAVELINRRAKEDEKARPGSQAEAVRTLEAGRAEGEPIAPIDVLGENVRGLAGRGARKPGPGREIARRFAESRKGDVDRDSTIAASLKEGIARLLGTGSAKSEAEHLADARSGRARQVWARAEQAINAMPKIEEQLARQYPEAQNKAAKAEGELSKASERLAAMERDAEQQSVRVPKEPVRLTTFLIRGGGIQDQGGEVSHIIGGRKVLNRRPGARNDEASKLQHRLVKAEGQALDDAALEAWEAGYVPTSERPTIAEFLDAVAQDVNGRAVYSGLELDQVAEYESALARNAEASRARRDRPMPEQARVNPAELTRERDNLAQLEAIAEHAREEAAELKALIEAGQADGTLGLSGAVTSPAIRQLVKNPRIRQGLAKGAKIERDNADAELRRVNLRDYAVVAEEPNGDPVIGAVPTMKLLMVAKQGLDAMLESEQYRDPLTRRLNQEGRGIARLRDTFLKELDRLNPEYKAARDQWAGDSALIKAIADGKQFDRWEVEEIEERMKGASDSEKKFLRLGYADTLRTKLDKKQLEADPSKAIINSTADRKRIEAVAGSPDAAEKFVDKVKRSREQFKTPVDLVGNSKTAAREAEDQSVESGAHLATGLAKTVIGHPLSAVRHFWAAAHPWVDPRAIAQPEVMAAGLRLLLADPQFSNLKLNPVGDLISKFPMRNAQPALQRMAISGLRRPIPNAMLRALGRPAAP